MDKEIKEPRNEAAACMIWLHGLGADASDMKMLVDALDIDSLAIRHVFLNAPIRSVTINNHMQMPAWYDILGLNLTAQQDKQGIVESEKLLLNAIEEQKAQGIKHVFLAGFSQGGAICLFTGLRLKQRLAGIIALSCYIPLLRELEQLSQPQDTPIFMAAGLEDPVVQYTWSKASHDFLTKSGFSELAWHSYPMEHAICNEELGDIRHWITNQMHDK